ncbi:MAG: murein L,D-transpeptidase [Phenylobacterium sp.]|uniref:L,D-transpeptidase family protein n=1 Tax=Phenylobacterium sp. TaxID=1871053 RepID=UPI00391CD058
MSACDIPLRAGEGADTGQARLRRSDRKALRTALAEAPSHGFAPGAFGEQRIDELSGPEADAGLRAAILAYAGAMRGHALTGDQRRKDWAMRPAPFDAEAEFRAAVQERRVDAWLQGLAPQAPEYEALRVAYGDYLKIAQSGGWPSVPAGASFRAGAGGPHVRALRERLAAEGDLAWSEPDAPFDPALGQAVLAFQARHGLRATGAVDAETLKALNVSPAARAAQIRANLERWRWAPREPSPDRVEVNAAAGLMVLHQNGQASMRMLAAAGKPGDETPILVSDIDHVVLNPPWNVPDSIAEAELLPKEAQNPGYLAREGFILDPPGLGLRLQQKPGPKNALGRVKFQFDNPFAVYLHDTPAKAAFSRPQRTVSHGCVRLERAVDLAKVVLEAHAGWTPGRVDEALAQGDTRNVALERPLQVLLMYWTAFPTTGGQVAFRPDVYGWDEAVLRRLDAKTPSPA